MKANIFMIMMLIFIIAIPFSAAQNISNQTQTAQLELNECPDSQIKIFMLSIIIIIYIILILMGFFFSSLVGIIASIMGFVIAFYINSCTSEMGFLIGAINILLFIHFILRKN